MILDTSFLLDLKDGDHAAFERATELYETETIQRNALPPVMELHYGAAFVESDDERRRIENLLGMYPIAPMDADIARRAGEMVAAADREAGGTSGVDNEDALIAATAERFDEPVLTHNRADFEALNVETEGY